MSLCFLTFSIALLKTELFIKEVLFASVLSLIFISIDGFSHAVYLNSITPWVNAFFKVLVCTTLFSSRNCIKLYGTFQFSFFSGNDKPLRESCRFLDSTYDFKYVSFVTIFVIIFYRLFIKVSLIISAFKTINKNVHPHRLFTSQYIRYDDT